LGQLLETYRNYLKLLARLQVKRRLQSKVDASDVVQETFIEVQRSIGGFRGASEDEFAAWLRRILASRIADLVRRFYSAQQRDVRLERQLDEEMDRSSHVAQGLLHSASSPSKQTSQHEQAVLVTDAVAKLATEYQEVITLRHFEDLSFPEVAQQMCRSVDSVKGLWVRALAALRRSLGEPRNG
jgi:RNA polymerase sigma-70 factor (ECF subfamily)